VQRRTVDIMEGARAEPEEGTRAGKGRGRGAAAARKLAEPAEDYRTLSPDQIAARIKQLEARMYKHAQDLEFEDAARLRDQIHTLREQALIG
jgi:excinuclease ABC subunit B